MSQMSLDLKVHTAWCQFQLEGTSDITESMILINEEGNKAMDTAAGTAWDSLPSTLEPLSLELKKEST